MSDEHPSFLAHHFESAGQQFEAGKLGMWLFLATEVLLFGGLFCGYVIFRNLHPEMFAYGSQFLDVRWGATNTCILIISSLTMATAVTTTQQGRRGLSLILLLITFMGGVGFMAIKYVEYSHKIHDNLVWGVRFYEEPAHALIAHDDTGEVAEIAAADPVRGNELWMSTCRSCHGVQGEGIPGQGKDQRNSEFIRGLSDDKLVDFIKIGRMPFDPANTTGIQMPPKGGNPMLVDEDLVDIVAYMRSFAGLDPSKPLADLGEADEAAAVAAAGDGTAEELYVERWVIPDPPVPPSHMNVIALDADAAAASMQVEAGPPDPRHDPNRPANAHMFFAIYFLMTGLHGVHVIIGMAVIGWLTWLTYRRRFSAEYFTPVDLGGLYWHVVDLIWIFLFPLFYLI